MEKLGHILSQATAFYATWLFESNEEYREWRDFANGDSSFSAESSRLSEQGTRNCFLRSSSCGGGLEEEPEDPLAAANANIAGRRTMLAASPNPGTFTLFDWSSQSRIGRGKQEMTKKQFGFLSSPFSSLVIGHSWAEKEDSESLAFTVEEQANIAQFQTIVPISLLSLRGR